MSDTAGRRAVALCGLAWAALLLTGCGGPDTVTVSSMPGAPPSPITVPAVATIPAAPPAQPAATPTPPELPEGVERDYSLVRGARVFTCNYYTELNGNDAPDRGEFAGVKTRFRKGERIIIVVELPPSATPGLEVRTKIWGPKGKVIQELTAPVAAQGRFYRLGDQEASGAEYDLMGWLMAKGGPGTYRVGCFVKGLFLCTCDFEVME